MSPKSEAKMAEIEELLDVSSSLFLLLLSARLTRHWQRVSRNLYFYIDLKNSTKVIYELILDANFRHLGFTFLIGRMTEVLAPDI